MKRDRFLIGILGGIAVLAIVAVVLFWVRRERLDYTTESGPSGVVQNYVVALQKGDFERAYQALADASGKPTQSVFAQSLTVYQAQELSSISLEITGETVSGDTAWVGVSMLRPSGGLFADVYREQQRFDLVSQSGEWKIQSAPYPFWDYSWYPTENGKPIAP